MRIRMKTAIAGRYNARKGKEIEVADAVAGRLVSAGYAEYLETAKGKGGDSGVETATKPARETAARRTEKPQKQSKPKSQPAKTKKDG